MRIQISSYNIFLNRVLVSWKMLSGFSLLQFLQEFRCNSDALFKAGDAVCRFNSPQPNGRLTPQEVQAAERLPSPNVPFQIATHTTPLSLASNAWGNWIASSDCRFRYVCQDD